MASRDRGCWRGGRTSRLGGRSRARSRASGGARSLRDGAVVTAETHRPGRMGRVTVWQNDQPRQIEMTWGLEPIEPGGKPISLLRWEGREISNPCLIIANDFGLKIEGVVKYRAKLVTEAPCFCIAGIWRPAKGSWPASYAALTTDAYPDLAPYKDRHVAVVREEDWIAWLTQARPVADM